MLIEKPCCIFKAVLALLVTVTIAAPVEETAVKEKPTDDPQTAEKTNFKCVAYGK